MKDETPSLEPPSVKTAICQLTGRKFTYKPVMLFGKEAFVPRYHPEVVEAMQRDEEHQKQLKEQERREAYFAASCPPMFLETDEKLLPSYQWQSVKQWSPSDGRGLLLIGPTGRGKTRCAWQRLRLLHLAHGMKFEFLTEINFTMQAIEQLLDGRILNWLKNLYSMPLLVIDDIGKAKHTDRTREALFDVVDTRMAYQRPIIFTTQLTGDELQSKLVKGEEGNDRMVVEETAQALLRRMRESSTVVMFS